MQSLAVGVTEVLHKQDVRQLINFINRFTVQWQQLFQPFERLELGADIQGTGLGLVICLRMMKAMWAVKLLLRASKVKEQHSGLICLALTK
ncbi:MAG: hypothetical protein RQ783_05965 [Gammaproteobacteria bacterium]|nr:hypothetical protein [Gammaproteobacteria bacterium]